MMNLRWLITVVLLSQVKPFFYDYLEVYPDPRDPEILKGRTPLYFALIQSLGRPPSQFDGSGSVAGVKIALDRINNDSSLLPGYTLHYTFTDSACDQTTSLDALHYQLLHEPRKIAVIGAGCSVATEQTAEISHYYNITQISCASSSATLRDRVRYPKYFQLLSSAELLAFGFYGVIREYGWRRVALIVQDENQFTIAMRHLTSLLALENVEYTESIFSTSSGIAGLGSNIFDRESRIFLLAMYESHARRLLCEAYKQEVYLPRSMLLTNGLYTSLWWRIEHPDVTCTIVQRERVLLSTLAVTHFDSPTIETTPDITDKEFSSEERKFLRQPPLNIWLSQYCHDATWTLTYALNSTINSLKDRSTNERIAESFNLSSPFTLREFSYSSHELLEIIFGHLENTSFYGITGPVRFEKHGIRKLQELVTFQYRRKSNVTGGTISLDIVEIGTVNPENYLFSYTAGENFSTVWNDFKVPYDGVPRRRFVSVHAALSVIVILLSCGGIMFATLCLIFNFVFRKTKLIRLASSRLNSVIGIGAILVYIATIVLVIPTTDPGTMASICHTSSWLSSIGYSLCYGTILVKMARVYYIFNGPTMWKKADHGFPSKCESVYSKVAVSNSKGSVVTHAVTIKSDQTWTLHVLGKQIDTNEFAVLQPYLPSIPSGKEASLLNTLNQLQICPGHPDNHFVDMLKYQKGWKGAALVDDSYSVCLDGSHHDVTVRHINCSLLIANGTRCCTCKAYRSTLRALYSRHVKQQSRLPSSPKSHVNIRYLRTPDMQKKFQAIKAKAKAANRRLENLKAKISKEVAMKGVELEKEMDHDMAMMMDECTEYVEQNYPPDSFERLFWEEQRKARKLKSAKQMRWHPMMIRWCLRIKHISTAAYSAFRSSGLLKLPSERTLRDYSNWVKVKSGFQQEVDQQLIEEAELATIPDFQKYVCVVFDEVKIKEGLVYDKEGCNLIGLVDLDSINKHLQAYEQSLSESDSKPQLATHIVAFMVRGLFSNLKFPYVQFPCASLTAHALYALVWECVSHLETLGFKVLALTADGASCNRKFFRMHKSKQKSFPHKTDNLYADEDRPIFFFSDPPHLMKTVRNCWSNSFGHSYTRKMWVLSKSVAEAINLELEEKPYLAETQKFVMNFNKFFDCFNVRCLKECILKRKPDVRPYNSSSDNRLEAVPDVVLLLGVACFVSIDLVILLSHLITEALSGELQAADISPNRENPTVIERGPQEVIISNNIYVCHAIDHSVYLGALFGYKMVLGAFGLLLAFAIRNVKIKGLNDSAYIVAATYVTSTMLIALIVATYTLKEFVNTLAAISCTGYQVGTTIVLLLTFGPQMVNLYKDPKGSNILHGLTGASQAITTKETEDSNSDEVEVLRKRILKLESDIREKDELLATLMKADHSSSKESILQSQGSPKFSEDGIQLNSL